MTDQERVNDVLQKLSSILITPDTPEGRLADAVHRKILEDAFAAIRQGGE